MSTSILKVLLSFFALLFCFLFFTIVMPPFLQNPDVVHAFSEGFVNPYSSGFSWDTILCWCILATWIFYEFKKVKYGWCCLIIGLVPGVAVGFAAYLLLRLNQLGKKF